MKIDVFKLQGSGGTLQSRLEDDKIIVESMLNTIRSLKEDIDQVELFKLCLANVMKDSKGHMNPNYANNVIKHYLERYIKTN